MTNKLVRGSILGVMISMILVAVALGQQQPSPQMQAANQLIKEQKWAEAATALDKIVAETPTNGRAWFLLGAARHRLGDYTKAVDAYEKNIPISNNPTAMYNLACSYSRLKNTDKAIGWLEKSMQNGGGQGVDLNADDDLANIRNDARFKKLLETADRAANPCK